jgi:hypothetical protein
MCASVSSSQVGVITGLGSHNTGTAREEIDAFYATTEALAPEDIADGITYMVTRPRRRPDLAQSGQTRPCVTPPPVRSWTVPVVGTYYETVSTS